MPIEFHCASCRKLLRVPDTSVGKKARCPDCGTIQDVAGPGEPPGKPGGASPGFDPVGGAVPTPAPSPEPSPFADEASTNPYASPRYPQSTAYAPTPVAYERGLALERVRAPATALIIISSIALGLLALVMVVSIAAGVIEGDVEDAIGGVVQSALGVAINILILVGAQRMKRLESYGMAIAAAILSITCNCGCLSLPFGIWALVVLCDSQVRAAFQS